MSDLTNGTVKWFNSSKGFGFIERKEGPGAFVHISAIDSNDDKILREGQKVKFILERGLRGFQAQNICTY